MILNMERRNEGLDAPGARIAFGVGVLFVVLTTLAVIGRFYSRRLKQVTPGLDDWLVVVALLCYYAQAVFHFLAIFKGGSGHHKSDVTVGEIEYLFRMIAYLQFAYALGLMFVRLSICFLFIRIFITRTFRYAAYGAMFLTISWCCFTVIDAILICRPFEFNWNRRIPGGHCSGRTAPYVTTAAWSVVCDMYIWLLPIPAVWRLQLPRVHKIALSCVFALGIIDVVAGIVRVIAILEVDFNGDITYTVIDGEIWGMAEVGIGIIVSCGPVLRPVFEKMIPDTLLHFSFRKPFSGSAEQSPGLSTGMSGSHDHYGKMHDRDEDDVELIKLPLETGWVTTTVVGNGPKTADSSESWKTDTETAMEGGQSRNTVESWDTTEQSHARGISMKQEVSVSRNYRE